MAHTVIYMCIVTHAPGMANEITKAMYHLEEEHIEDSDKGSLAEYQTTVLEQCEALARAAHQMVVVM